MQSRINIKQIAIGVLIGISVSLAANLSNIEQSILIAEYGFGKGLQTGAYSTTIALGSASAYTTCQAMKPANHLFDKTMDGVNNILQREVKRAVQQAKTQTLKQQGIADCYFGG